LLLVSGAYALTGGRLGGMAAPSLGSYTSLGPKSDQNRKNNYTKI
jgi:hypothetical protein